MNTYTEEQLREICKPRLKGRTLHQAVEITALDMFLLSDNDSDSANTIRAVLSDLNIHGILKFSTGNEWKEKRLKQLKDEIERLEG